MVEGKRTETHWPRWLARGALGGLVAGAAFLAVTMWFATSVGDPAKGPLLMMSTIVKGGAAMAEGTASAGVGLAVHAVLSGLFGVVFAAVASKLRTNGALAVAGTLYGVALYLVNFKIFAPTAFPVLEMANQPFELVVHVVFGSLLSLALFRLPSEGQASLGEAHRRSQVTAGARAVRGPGAAIPLTLYLGTGLTLRA